MCAPEAGANKLNEEIWKYYLTKGEVSDTICQACKGVSDKKRWKTRESQEKAKKVKKLKKSTWQMEKQVI